MSRFKKEPPEPTRVFINQDETISVTGDQDGCLFAIMSVANAKAVNTLDLHECLAVYLCVQSEPHPIGGEEKTREIYATILKATRSGQAWANGQVPKVKLGELRRYLVQKAGAGCNAPHDTYITLAAEVKRRAAIIPVHRPPAVDPMIDELFGF